MLYSNFQFFASEGGGGKNGLNAGPSLYIYQTKEPAQQRIFCANIEHLVHVFAERFSITQCRVI